jgi:ribosome-binding protein aMBF1 (putative translation factor)
MQSPIGQTHRDFVAEQREKDPEFAAEYEQMRALVEHEVALEALAERAEEELAHALAALRQSRHMSQRDLAEVCRIKQPMIARLERGKQSPAFPTLVKLAAALYAVVVISEEGVAVQPAEAAQPGKQQPTPTPRDRAVSG